MTDPDAIVTEIPKHTLPKTPDDIKLGFEVIDLVSKLQGSVSLRGDQLSGNIQFGIQPSGDGTSATSAEFVDWHQIGIVGPGIADRLPPIDQTAKHKLGEAVKDSVTGFAGTITERVIFQNGCVYFAVAPPVDKKALTLLPQTVLFDHKRIVRTGDGVSIKLAKPPEAPVSASVDKPKPPGGPSRAFSAMRRA